MLNSEIFNSHLAPPFKMFKDLLTNHCCYSSYELQSRLASKLCRDS